MRLIRFLFRLIYNLFYYFFKFIWFLLRMLWKMILYIMRWLKNWAIRQKEFWHYRFLEFALAFCKELFPFFIESCHFVNNRFVAWQLWNFDEHWSIYRIIIFLITVLSLIRPIYFICRWIGYLYFFLCNVIFIFWRAFFLEIFIYLFRFSIPPYEYIKVKHILYYLYREYSDFGNRFSLLVARGFGLVYIDFFVSYLDSLRYRNWDHWISDGADKIIYFIDEVFDLFVDVFAFYYYYKDRFLWYGPIYRDKITGFWKRVIRFFKRVLYTLRRWFSVTNVKLIIHRYKFYKSKYGRTVIRTQIKIYYVICKSKLVVAKLHLKIARKYYWSKLKYTILYYLYDWLLYIVSNIHILFLRAINASINGMIWLIFDTFLWTIFFKHIYVFFLWLDDLIFWRLHKRLTISKERFLFFLHDKPLFSYFLKSRYEFDEALFKKQVEENLQIFFEYYRKYPYMKITYNEKGRMVAKQIKDQEKIDELVRADVVRVRKMWLEDGEISPSSLARLTEMHIKVTNDKRIADALAFKANCEHVEKFILNKQLLKKREDEKNQKRILSLDDYFSTKNK